MSTLASVDSSQQASAVPERAMLGVMGGGQLGRMFVHAAQRLGFRVTVLDPDPRSPAGAAAERHIQAHYDDAVALADMAASCAAVTTEFENVPARALQVLAKTLPVAPAAAAVRVCQNRLDEKACFVAADVPCAPHAAVLAPADLETTGLNDLLPGVLKTVTLGYDGKGQVSVATMAELAAAWSTLGEVPCVLERRLPLRLEISVIVARGADGSCVHLPVQQNLHRDGVLAVTQVPAPDVSANVAGAAVGLAERLAQRLDYVGVLCVEFFVLQDGSLVANEMAPRPHNSGHGSIDACDLSQFELQVRTLAGMPLVQPRQHSAAVMLNLLGDLWLPSAPRDSSDVSTPQSRPRAPDWSSVLRLPGAHLHLYGKQEPRSGRKMGHLTLTAADPDAARRLALRAAALLKLPAF